MEVPDGLTVVLTVELSNDEPGISNLDQWNFEVSLRLESGWRRRKGVVSSIQYSRSCCNDPPIQELNMENTPNRHPLKLVYALVGVSSS